MTGHGQGVHELVQCHGSGIDATNRQVLLLPVGRWAVNTATNVASLRSEEQIQDELATIDLGNKLV